MHKTWHTQRRGCPMVGLHRVMRIMVLKADPHLYHALKACIMFAAQQRRRVRRVDLHWLLMIFVLIVNLTLILLRGVTCVTFILHFQVGRSSQRVICRCAGVEWMFIAITCIMTIQGIDNTTWTGNRMWRSFQARVRHHLVSRRWHHSCPSLNPINPALPKQYRTRDNESTQPSYAISTAQGAESR